MYVYMKWLSKFSGAVCPRVATMPSWAPLLGLLWAERSLAPWGMYIYIYMAVSILF